MTQTTEWRENGWEADYFAGHLILTNPQGDLAEVGLRDTATGRNITLRQWRSSVKTHGVTRSAETFWKLRASQ